MLHQKPWFLSLNLDLYLCFKILFVTFQVSGDVYAVDEWTLLLVNFNYDGTGDDTFFWAGDSGRPGPQGFIVQNEHGKSVSSFTLI